MVPGDLVAGLIGVPPSEQPRLTRSTPVLRCTFDVAGDIQVLGDLSTFGSLTGTTSHGAVGCEVAAEGFWGANGLTVNADRHLLVSRYERERNYRKKKNRIIGSRTDV